MLSFIAIGFLAVVCYVADSEQSFVLCQESVYDGSIVPHFRAHDGFLSELKAGTYEFKLQTEWDGSFASESYWKNYHLRWHFPPYWTFVLDHKKDLPRGRTDDIVFVLDLNGQAGCKLQYGDTYYLQEAERNHSPLIKIDEEMKYAAHVPGFYSSKQNISVELKGHLVCPADDTFVLIGPFRTHCRGGTEDYLKGEESTGIFTDYGECKAGRDVISGNWPEEITYLKKLGTPVAFDDYLYLTVKHTNHTPCFVTVCRLHPSKICRRYKGRAGSKFELQPLPESSNRGRDSKHAGSRRRRV